MSDLHQCFTVSETSYLRNLDADDLSAPCVAVHYQKPPVRNEEAGTTSYGLCFPTLIVTGYLEKPREIAERVASILNANWDADLPARITQLEADRAELVERLTELIAAHIRNADESLDAMTDASVAAIEAWKLNDEAAIDAAMRAALDRIAASVAQALASRAV